VDGRYLLSVCGAGPQAFRDTGWDTRARQKFNHLRGLVLGGREEARRAFPSPDRPDPAFFRELDERILYMNRKGIIADLVLAGDENHLVELFPTREQRERYIRFLVGRYAAMHITWQGVQEFEEYRDGRALLKEIGELLKRLDPYGHPRSTHAVATSSPLAQDGWMTHLVYQSHDDQLGAIEHQIYAMPQVNARIRLRGQRRGQGSASPCGHGHVSPPTLERQHERAVSHVREYRHVWRPLPGGRPLSGFAGRPANDPLVRFLLAYPVLGVGTIL
jgi:hypothetical protein